jgi:hypothetical protein
MSRVIAAHAVSVDGYITGREPGPGRGLGDGGVLFDWYNKQPAVRMSVSWAVEW